MNKLKFTYPVIAASVLLAAMTACFTGIESTPKITDSEIRRQNVRERPEDSYLSEIKAEPFEKWAQGKKFHVTDNRFSLLLLPSEEKCDSLSGKVIRFVSGKEVIDLTGNRILELTFLTDNNNPIRYRTTQSRATIESTGKLNIPFLVELSVIEQVREKLLGKTFYVITANWYDDKLSSFTGRKFIPVKITDIRPGNEYYSALLELIDENGAAFHLFMSVGNDLKTLRSFGSLFSLSDPRKSHPDISDETWRNIINGRVSSGMTRDECRLALGAPASIDSRIGYSTIREVWTYENGIYLIFEDNLLKSFRQ